MAASVTIAFTPNLARHVDTPAAEVSGSTVAVALENYFQCYPDVRGYVLDDQGAVRKHVVIFVNNTTLQDRLSLSDQVLPGADIYVAQALSGG